VDGYEETGNETFFNITSGFNQPRDCTARQRTAIIIPYRNREKHNSQENEGLRSRNTEYGKLKKWKQVQTTLCHKQKH